MIYLASLEEGIEDKLNRYVILHTREEVANVVIDCTHANTIIFRNDFISKYYTPSGFEEFISSTRRVNPNIIIKLDEDLGSTQFDEMTQKINRTRTLEELMTLISYYPNEVYDTIKSITSNIEEHKEQFLGYSAQISELQNRNLSLTQEAEELMRQLELQQLTDESIKSRLNILISRINYQYGINYNADKTFVVDKNSYDKVIYIKEITRVQYIDTFIYFLREILKVIYGMPTRTVVIESYYADAKVPLYKDLKPHYELTHEDVLSGNILMLGMQPKIMTDVLKNASNISFLIVLDRAGYSEPHITGDNVEYLFTASDMNDVPDTIDKSRVISYDENNLSIPYIERFDELDMTNKMALYSSFPITKSIVDLLNTKGE
jgi:regulator of replication initiation timing